jgi:hypothetical protein
VVLSQEFCLGTIGLEVVGVVETVRTTTS